MVLCLGEPPGGFCNVGFFCSLFFLIGGFYVSELLFLATSTPSWLLRSAKAFTSPSTLATFGSFTFARLPVTVLPRALRFSEGIFYPEAFFTSRSFTDIFDTFCDSNASRNTQSRILLSACPHRVVPSDWRMDLNNSYCSYKNIDLSIAPVSHELYS